MVLSEKKTSFRKKKIVWRPATGDPVEQATGGEVVVKPSIPGHPMVRLAPATCRRVSPDSLARRAHHQHAHQKGWMGRADQTQESEGHVRAARPDRRGSTAPSRARARSLVVSRENEQDAMTLNGELRDAERRIAQTIAETLASVDKAQGGGESLRQASLPNDGKVIADELPVSGG